MRSCRKWERRNQAVLLVFWGYALVVLLSTWGILAFVNCTWCCTCQQQWAWEYSFYNLFWNFASKKSTAPLRKKLAFGFGNQQKLIHLCWENDGRNPKLSSTCSSLSEETLKFLSTGFYFKTNRSVTNHCTYQWWQLLQATKCSCMQSWSAVVKEMTFLGIFISGETGNSLFSKDVYSPSIYLDPHPPPSQVFFLCWRPVLSRSYSHVPQSNKDTRKYRAVNSLRAAL